jgi:predicted DNA-binding transcriptional regulator AlpA
MFRKEVLEFFKCSPPTLWNSMRLKQMPRPIICEGRDAWWEDELLAWAESKPRRRYKGDPPPVEGDAK